MLNLESYDNAEFREFSKFSFSSLHCHFRGKITKMIYMVDPEFLRIPPTHDPYAIFGLFYKNNQHWHDDADNESLQ